MNEYFCTSPGHAPITFLTVRGRVYPKRLQYNVAYAVISRTHILKLSQRVLEYTDSHDI